MSAPPREDLKIKEAVLTSDKDVQKTMESVQKSLKGIHGTVRSILATMLLVIICQVLGSFLEMAESSARESRIRELQQQLSK